MLIALIIITMLVCVYCLERIRIPISVYAMVATFPYKSLIMDYCPWLDTVLELLLLVEVFLLMGHKIVLRKSCRMHEGMFLFVFVLLLDTLFYSTCMNDPEFLFSNKDTRFFIGTYILLLFINNVLNTWEEFESMCKVYVINGLFLVAFGAIYWQMGISESLYAFDNKNIFAMQLCLDVYLCLYVAYIVKGKRNRYRALAVVFAISVLLTASTAATLALLFGIGVAVLQNIPLARKFLFKIVLIFVIFIGIYAVSITIGGQIDDSLIINTIMNSKGYYDDTRVYIWSEALESFEEHWLIGIGADNFRTQNMRYSFATHNDYLMFLTNYGVIGFLAFLFLSIVMFRRVFRIRDKILFQVGFSIIIGLYFYILTHNYVNYIIFWTVLEIVMCSQRLSLREERRARNLASEENDLYSKPLFD